MMKNWRVRDQNFLRVWLWIYPYVRKSKAEAILLTLSSTMSGLTMVIFIQIFMYFLENLSQQKDPKYMIYVLSVFLLSTMLRGFGSYAQTLLSIKLREDLGRNLKTDLFKKFQQLPFSYYKETRTGSMMSQMNGETEMIKMGFETYSMLLSNVFSIVALSANAIVISPKMTLVAMMVFPFTLLVRGSISKIYSASKQLRELISKTQHRLIENIVGVRMIRVYQREADESEKFLDSVKRVNQAQLEIAKHQARISLVLTYMNLAGGGAVLFLCGQSVIRGEMSIAQLMAFTTSVAALYGPMSQFAALKGRFERLAGEGESLFKTLNQSASQEEGHAELKRDLYHINFEKVSFSYSSKEKPVLLDVNFEVHRGDVITILGANGGGKSTLVNLIPRFYDPSEGRITFNGIDTKDLKIQNLRSQIAMVTQEMFLFDSTIYENIAFGNPHASESQIIEAAKSAYAHEFISALPEGYKTLVGERGARLSEGQKQRISIARAFVKNAPILILDEPTSALDMSSKDSISQALMNLMEDRFVFLITHQMSIIPSHSRILKIENGRLNEVEHSAQDILRTAVNAG